MASQTRYSNIFSEQHAMRMKKPERIKYRDRWRISANCIIFLILLISMYSFYYCIQYLIQTANFEEHHGHSLESLLNEGLPPHPKFTSAPTNSPTEIIRTPRLRKIERHIST